jgi:hypothetical protein
MMTSSKDITKQAIINALSEAGADMPCPRCGNKTFTLIEGYQAIQLSTEPELPHWREGGGSIIPTIMVICNKCGYLMQHALGAFGLLPPEGENDDRSASRR